MDATEYLHETPEGFVALAKRRRISGGLYQSFCLRCRCSMKVDSEHLAEELSGTGPVCAKCGHRGGTGSGYGGSPQSRTDNAYHGGRYHSAEWEG